MNNLTKGALAMVLAGSVTFSVSNALLATPPVKQLKEKIASTITGDRKKADIIKENPMSTPNNKERQTKLSHTMADSQGAINNRNNSDKVIATIQKNTKEPTTNPSNPNVTPNTKPTAPITIPATSTKATPPATTINTSSAPTTTTTPTTNTGANTSSGTTSTSNYGQQVSQAAKEKAASRPDIKENKGKKSF